MKKIVLIFFSIIFAFLFFTNTSEGQTISNNGLLNHVNITSYMGNVSNTANVSNWSELKAAMFNSSISNINVSNDICNDENDSSQEKNVQIPLRSINVNGNGHKVDFRGTSFFNNDNVPSGSSIAINIHDITMYGQDWFGPFKYYGVTNDGNGDGYGSGNIYHNNVNYIGSQLTASYHYNLNFSGHINNKSVNSYISPFNGNTYSTKDIQFNLEATNVDVSKNATYTGSTENAGVVLLSNNGSLNIEDDATMDLTSGGTGGEDGDNVVRVQGKLTTGNNSKLNINTRPYVHQKAIELDSGSGTTNLVHITNNSTLKINNNNSNNSGGYNLVQVASNTQFLVDDHSEFDLNSNTPATINLIHADSSSKFEIGGQSTFRVTASGAGQYNLLDFDSNSNFLIDNATIFDLDARKNNNQNTNLIYMDNGNLKSTIQTIYAWNKSNNSNQADKSWSSIFNTNIPYNGGQVQSGITADSPDSNNLSDFKSNFQSQNYDRLLLTYVPDINLSIRNDLTSVKSNPNSSKIEGKALPGSYIKFTGDSPIPEGTISGQLKSDPNKYNVKSDSNGNYSYQLPAGKHLSAGSQVEAYAELNGKNDRTSQKVKQGPAGTLNNYLTNSQSIQNNHFALGEIGKYNNSFTNTGDTDLYNANFEIKIPKQFSVDKDTLELKNNNQKISDANLIDNGDGSYTLKLSSNEPIKVNQTVDFSFEVTVKENADNIPIISTLIGSDDVNNSYKIDQINSNDIHSKISNPDISMTSAPNSIEFKNNKISLSKPESYNSTSSDDKTLQVTDNRTDKVSGWSVSASMDEFKSNDGGILSGASLTVPKGNVSNNIDYSFLNNDSTTIDANNSGNVLSYAGNSNHHEDEIINNNWSGSAFKLNVPPNTAKEGENHSATITWNLNIGV